jgi:penicillin amidase
MLTLSGCAIVSKKSASFDDRLAAFPINELPLEGQVTVRWNEYQVPFVEADTDRDLAFAMGLIHAHLRGGQITILKRATQGRLSESAGPFTTDIDHALRIIDFGYAAEEIARNLPDETRVWLQAFVDGLNYYQDNAKDLPPEFGLLNIEPEPWRIEDIITIARLASTDVNWLSYFTLLQERGKPTFQDTLDRALEAGANPTTSFRNGYEEALLSDFLAGMTRSGSNSLAVSPSRSVSGGALIASDPHLGLILPNLWVLAGMKSPSFHVVGLMIPGVPIVAIGRNPDLAWGGTNLRAAVSDFYDVSNVPASEIEENTVTIKTRLWFDEDRTVRRTKYGPIISDIPLLGDANETPVALKWIGHEPTDEMTALINAARAKTPDQFRRAFSTFAISAQNMVFADRKGNIGQIIATIIPKRNTQPIDDIVFDPEDPQTQWSGYRTSMDLPYTINPLEGYIASANNIPTKTKAPIGYFFSDDDRVRRLQAVLKSNNAFALEDLTQIQMDTKSPDALIMKNALIEMMQGLDLEPENAKFVETLAAWDGDYNVNSRGAVLFETLLFHLTPQTYGVESAEELPPLAQQWTFLSKFLTQDLAEQPVEARQQILRDAIDAAQKDATQYKNWGEMHHMVAAHLLGNVPLIGDQFIVADYPVGGSRETPMKTAHNLVNEKHQAAYGSQARHISDMSDLDANYFVLFGGEDGWIGSDNFADQMDLWREGKYIHMPLSDRAVKEEFPYKMILAPN